MVSAREVRLRCLTRHRACWDPDAHARAAAVTFTEKYRGFVRLCDFLINRLRSIKNGQTRVYARLAAFYHRNACRRTCAAVLTWQMRFLQTRSSRRNWRFPPARYFRRRTRSRVLAVRANLIEIQVPRTRVCRRPFEWLGQNFKFLIFEILKWCFLKTNLVKIEEL